MNFCKFPIFFADSKSRAQELSNDVSFVILGHQTWDLEWGGAKLTPPLHILVFKYPSRDRVKNFSLSCLDFSFLSAFILLLIHVTYYSQRHNQEGLWGLSPPPRTNEIYWFQRVFRPQWMLTAGPLERKKSIPGRIYEYTPDTRHNLQK